MADRTAPARRTGSRQLDKAQTRQRLAQAAIAEFEENGYVACSIEEIAKRAGTSRATFYVHFTGKAELAEGMWDVVRHKLTLLYRELGRYERRDRETLRSWMVKTFDFYSQHRSTLLAVHEAIAVEPTLAAAYSDRTGLVADMIAPLVVGGRGLDPGTARFRASLLTIQHERFCYFWLLRDVPFEREQAVEGMTDVWFELIGTD
jgi:AcrR family transcriptional regulator